MELIAIIGFVITSAIVLNHFFHNYWSRRKFHQLKPKFVVGDIGDLFRLKKSIAEIFGELYEKSKKWKFVGLYFVYRPALLVNDPELIRNILVKDFQYFMNHGLYVDTEYDPLSGHLFSLSGEKWKNLRAKLSPLFSPGKFKVMYPTFYECAVNLQSFVRTQTKSENNVIEIRDLFARYTTDIIASVAFGFSNDSINDPNNIFRQMGSKVFKPSLKSGLRALVTFLMPKLNKLFGIKVADEDVEQFMFDIVKKTIAAREESGETRSDFMQMMIKLKNEGFVRDEDSKDANEDQDGNKLSLEEVVAQAFVFFIASFETTSSTMALCLYELTKNPMLQYQIQREIDDLLSYRKVLDYGSMSQLSYLERSIDETLRKYPPAPFLIRECEKDYKIPDSELVIEAGTPVIISLFGLQRDPNIFKDPLTFKPSRFQNSPTGGATSSGLSYLPFGDGPRVCIGQRMGKLTARLGLAMLLSKFYFEFAGEEPKDELTFSPQQFVLTLKDNINLRVATRSNYFSPVKRK